MSNYKFSAHAHSMLNERNIAEKWVTMTIENPDRQERKEDGTEHYIKVIEDYGNRYLRVIVNPGFDPVKIITVFFDRRLGRKI